VIKFFCISAGVTLDPPFTGNSAMILNVAGKVTANYWLSPCATTRRTRRSAR